MKEVEEMNAAEGFQGSPFSEVVNNLVERPPIKLSGLSHTGTEQMLYELMFNETRMAKAKVGTFSIRELMIKSGIHNYSSLRRAQIGLVNKMSIERQKPHDSAKSSATIYKIFSPSEILERRREAGFNPYPKEKSNGKNGNSSARAIERLVERHNLSRRQAQVALKCAEGLTNAEIGVKLFIQQETVKFHLRNIFVKFGVKRRTELIAHLFQQELIG